MQYKVTRQYLRDKEKGIAEFTNFDDAKLFINVKLEADMTLKLNIIYRIFDMDECIEEFNQDKLTKSKSEAARSDGMSSGSINRPSPFSTTLQPGSSSAKWSNNEDDK